MSIGQSLLGEWDAEVANTVRMLSVVPDGKGDWAPHAKSMSLGRIATHIAELPDWSGVTLNFPELDFAKFDYKPTPFTTTAENVAVFKAKAKAAREVLANAADATFMEPWTLRKGEQVYFTMPKIAVIRSFVFNHMIHHRAQLSVYLRLLDVKFPGMYGPTADDPM